MPCEKRAAMSRVSSTEHLGQAQRPFPWPMISLSVLEPFTDERGVAIAPGRSEYLTGDNGRALALAVRKSRDSFAPTLAESCLAHLIHAERASSGEAVRGLALAAARAPWPQLRRVARELFESSRDIEFQEPRAWAHAALGAAAVLRQASYSSVAAFVVIRHAEAALGEAGDAPVVAQARLELAQLSGAGDIDRELAPLIRMRAQLCAQGHLLTDRPTVALETVDCFVSAYRQTRDAKWSEAAVTAAEWFVGRNAAGRSLWEPKLRQAHDGLARSEVVPSTSAGATLSLFDAMQHARALRR